MSLWLRVAIGFSMVWIHINNGRAIPLNNILIVEVFERWNIESICAFPSCFGYIYFLIAGDYVCIWSKNDRGNWSLVLAALNFLWYIQTLQPMVNLVGIYSHFSLINTITPLILGITMDSHFSHASLLVGETRFYMVKISFGKVGVATYFILF